MASTYNGMLVIDDDSDEWGPALNPPDCSKGLTLGLRSTPYGQMYGTEAFPQSLLIPRSEWASRIQEMEERKSTVRDICNLAGLPCKDQGQTNYCWINAPVYCVEVMRVVQNQPIVLLSPASVGAKIKGFRNQGGWGEEGLRYIVEHGVVPVKYWPANAIQKQYDTVGNWAAAAHYRVPEWWELVPRNLDQMASCLLRRIPVAVGYNWWGHEVTAVGMVVIDNDFGLIIRNSWGMGWGDKGYGILRGNRMLPDDAVCVRVAVAA